MPPAPTGRDLMPSRAIPRLLALSGFAAALLAGCGGSSLHADCRRATTAATNYTKANEALNFNLSNTPAVNRLLSASRSLRSGLKAVAGHEQGADRALLENFAGKLALQEQVIDDLLAGRNAEAARLAPALNGGVVPAGLANLQRVCAKA